MYVPAVRALVRTTPFQVLSLLAMAIAIALVIWIQVQKNATRAQRQGVFAFATLALLAWIAKSAHSWNSNGMVVVSTLVAAAIWPFLVSFIPSGEPSALPWLVGAAVTLGSVLVNTLALRAPVEWTTVSLVVLVIISVTSQIQTNKFVRTGECKNACCGEGVFSSYTSNLALIF